MLLIRDARQAAFRNADGLLDGMMRRGRSDSLLRHRPVGFAAECDGLEDPPYAHTIGSASHLAPGLCDRAGDNLQDRASTVGAWRGSQSKRHMHFFKELLSLRLRKTNSQPGEARQ